MSNVLDDIYNGIINTYGLHPMSLEDEINQPYNAKRTRCNKIIIIDTCKHMENLIETIKYRAKMAPELNDSRHADLVQEMTDKVNEAYKAIEAACNVGYTH